MEMLSMVFTVVAIIGALLNSYQRPEGFYFWIASNTFFVLFNLHYNHTAVAALFAMYLIISINGIFTWKRSG